MLDYADLSSHRTDRFRTKKGIPLKIKRHTKSRSLFGKSHRIGKTLLLIASVAFLTFLMIRFIHESQRKAQPGIKSKKANTTSPLKPRPARTSMPSAISYTLPLSKSPEPVSAEPPNTEYMVPSFPLIQGKTAKFPFYYFPARYPASKRWRVSGRAWTHRPKIVFVIDDLGNNRKNESLFRALGNLVTYSILPQLPYTTYMNRLSEDTRAEVILHQPMESEIGKNPGPGILLRRMSEREIEGTLNGNLEMVYHFVGSNNHMGSLGSQDPRLVGEVLKLLRDRGAFFLDSHTSENVISTKLAPSIGIPVLVRDVFLDNVDERGAIREMIKLTCAKARAKGYAIAIGHDRANTLSVLLEDIPKLESEGFQVASLGDLIEHRLNRS